MVRGLCGGFFGWYPYVVISTMFVSDCITHIDCLKILSKLVKKLDEDSLRLAYFGYYRTMRLAVKSYRSLLAVQLAYLAMAVTINFVTILAAHYRDTDDDGDDGWGDYRLLAIAIALLCFLQCATPILYAGLVNKRADELRRTIAKRPKLHWLLAATEVCYPGVEVAGAQISFGKVMVLFLTYSGILLASWVKAFITYNK